MFKFKALIVLIACLLLMGAKNWEEISSSFFATIEIGTKKSVALNDTVIFWQRITNHSPLSNWDTSLLRVYADCNAMDYIVLMKLEYFNDKEVYRLDEPSPVAHAIMRTPIYDSIFTACANSLPVTPNDINIGVTNG